MNTADAVKLPIADVYITDELKRRAPKRTDYLQEKNALQDLAGRMFDHPEEVLPRFVDLAMEMTGGVAAGLSLYEEKPEPGVFRWKYLQGILAPFEGATTPREFSPCGITLDCNAPVLSEHPERVYDWISDANIIVPEVLLVPLYIGGSEPLGTLWIVSEDVGHFDSGHARVLTELASFVGMALHMLRSREKLEEALKEQQTIAKEMSHRVKNLFAMTDGMIRISAKRAANKEELTEILSGRIHALASAHSLVSRDYNDKEKLSLVSDIKVLLQAITRPYEEADRKRFHIEGPATVCGETALNNLALVFHELTTNAAKYGALSKEQGHVDVQWQEEADKLVLGWTEHGGPLINLVPASRGFGSKLIHDIVVRQFGGTFEQDWKVEGLAAIISLPLEKLQH